MSVTTPSSHLVEEGEAFVQLSPHKPAPTARRPQRQSYDVIVIGAGQAGLSMGYHLARQGLKFVILEANECVGDNWRSRWDSLRLFTPARFDSLAGMPFPAPRHSFPSKDEMGDYLQAYAARFALPVKTGAAVERLWQESGGYVVAAGGREMEADQVVVAMANYQQPKVPAFAQALRSNIVQLHSRDYRRPAQLRDGRVLIVGAGNSGSEIAMELARDHEIWLSGRHTGQLPFRINGLASRALLGPLVLRFLFHRVLTVRTPIGRKLRPTFVSQGGPLIRVKAKDLAAAGVRWVGRTVGVEDGLPKLADGRVLNVANVVWCTGFHPGFDWIDLPIRDPSGNPRHHAGAVADAPGLYFVGLHFLYANSSAMVHGVGRDAARIADAIALRRRSDQSARPVFSGSQAEPA